MALRELLAEFGIEVNTEKLDAADKKISGFIEGVKKVGKALVAAYAVKEVYAFAEATAATIDHIDDTAAALGISADAVQQWGFAAKAAGDDADELLNMMGRLQVTAQGKEGGPAAAAFKELGISAKDASGKVKDADVLFGDVAEGLKNIEDPAKRAAIATELFGRGGRKLLPFLIQGRKGVEELRAEFHDLGGGFDDEAVTKAGEFQHAMAKVGVVVDGLKSVLVKGLFPALGWVADKAAAIGGWFVRVLKNTNAVRNAFILLGAYLTPMLATIAWGMLVAFAPLIPAALAVGALYLAFDEIVTLFEGGDTVIGETIDAIFGKGTSASMVQSIKDAWVEVKNTFRELWPYVQKIYEAMKWLIENTWKVSGAVGDWAGKRHGAGVEREAEASGAIKRGAGGLTFEEGTMARNAQAYMEARNRGEDVSHWHPTTVQKGMTDADVNEKVQAWVKRIESDPKLARFQPQTYGPTGPPVEAGNVTVNIQGSANMEPHEVKRAVAEGVNEARQKANRDAKHVLTQAAQK
jgi:hypothetical protein